jgi:spore maturation protein A
MLNILWPIFIIASFVFAIVTGKIDLINNSIFESSKDAVELSLSLLGTICLWSRNYEDCKFYKSY